MEAPINFIQDGPHLPNMPLSDEEFPIRTQFGLMNERVDVLSRRFDELETTLVSKDSSLLKSIQDLFTILEIILNNYSTLEREMEEFKKNQTKIDMRAIKRLEKIYLDLSSPKDENVNSNKYVYNTEKQTVLHNESSLNSSDIDLASSYRSDDGQHSYANDSNQSIKSHISEDQNPSSTENVPRLIHKKGSVSVSSEGMTENMELEPVRIVENKVLQNLDNRSAIENKGLIAGKTNTVGIPIISQSSSEEEPYNEQQQVYQHEANRANCQDEMEIINISLKDEDSNEVVPSNDNSEITRIVPRTDPESTPSIKNGPRKISKKSLPSKSKNNDKSLKGKLTSSLNHVSESDLSGNSEEEIPGASMLGTPTNSSSTGKSENGTQLSKFHLATDAAFNDFFAGNIPKKVSSDYDFSNLLEHKAVKTPHKVRKITSPKKNKVPTIENENSAVFSSLNYKDQVTPSSRRTTSLTLTKKSKDTDGHLIEKADIKYPQPTKMQTETASSDEAISAGSIRFTKPRKENEEVNHIVQTPINVKNLNGTQGFDGLKSSQAPKTAVVGSDIGKPSKERDSKRTTKSIGFVSQRWSVIDGYLLEKVAGKCFIRDYGNIAHRLRTYEKMKLSNYKLLSLSSIRLQYPNTDLVPCSSKELFAQSHLEVKKFVRTDEGFKLLSKSVRRKARRDAIEFTVIPIRYRSGPEKYFYFQENKSLQEKASNNTVAEKNSSLDIINDGDGKTVITNSNFNDFLEDENIPLSQSRRPTVPEKKSIRARSKFDAAPLDYQTNTDEIKDAEENTVSTALKDLDIAEVEHEIDGRT